MQAIKYKKGQTREDLLKNELLSKLFPEKTELDKLKSLEETKSAGEIKARIAIHQLFKSR